MNDQEKFNRHKKNIEWELSQCAKLLEKNGIEDTHWRSARNILQVQMQAKHFALGISKFNTFTKFFRSLYGG